MGHNIEQKYTKEAQTERERGVVEGGRERERERERERLVRVREIALFVLNIISLM